MRNVILTSAVVSLMGTVTAQNIVFATNDSVNQPAITSTAGTIGQGESSNTQKVLAFDFNDDTFTDIFYLNHNGTSVGWAGSATAPTTNVFVSESADVLFTSTAGTGAKGMCAFDWDGDLDMDVFIATGPTGGGQNDDLWLENTNTVPGTTSFTDVTGDAQHPTADDHSYDAAVYNAGGFNAIATASRVKGGVGGAGSGQNRVYLDGGGGAFGTFPASDGTFTTANPAEVLSTRALAVADMDGDGDDDIVLANGGNGVQPNQVAFQAVGGALPLTNAFGANEQSYGVAVADLGGADGDPEVIFANRITAMGGTSNSFYENNGDGTFTLVTATVLDDAMNASYGVCFADLDGDSDQDLVVANNEDDNKVYENVGGGGPFAADGWETSTNGLMQNNMGKSRGVSCAEFGDYGPDVNHQGVEVMFANTKPGGTFHNEFYRGMGTQQIDLGQGSTTPVTLSLDGFISATTGGTLTVNAPLATVGQDYFICFDTVLGNNGTFDGGTWAVGINFAAFLGPNPLVEGDNPGVKTGARPPVPSLMGQQVFVQAVTDTGGFPFEHVSNVLSVVIQ